KPKQPPPRPNQFPSSSRPARLARELSLQARKQWLCARSSYGGARPSRDFPLLAQYYLEGKLKLDELISQRIPLAEINNGFAVMKKGEGVRTVITFPN